MEIFTQFCIKKKSSISFKNPFRFVGSLSIICLVVLSALQVSYAQTTVIWRTDGPSDGKWEWGSSCDASGDGQWYYQDWGGFRKRPDCYDSHNLFFNGNNIESMNLNVGDFNVKSITFNAGATNIRTLTAVASNKLIFNANNGNPYLNNLSTANHVFNLHIELNNTIEINPASGNLTMASIDVKTNYIDVKGSSGRILTIQGVVSGSGGIATKNANVTTILTSQNTYTGTTYLDNGTLQLNRTGGNTLPSANNVVIASGATLRVSSNQTLNKITLNGGTITVDSGVTLTVGTIETTGGTISGSGVVKLTDVLTVSSGTFTTNNNVILVSTASNTARVAPVGGTISGNVTVERYIPAKRAWRALTAPLKGSSGSLYATWQNNGSTLADRGVTIWGPSGTNIATGPNYSVLNYTATGWSGVSNTATTNLFDSTKNNAYLVFVTGAYGTNNITSGASATTLQATGQLITGNVSYSNIINTKHTLLGNPYASPISPAQMFTTSASNMLNYVWVWDPNLGTTGGYNMYDIVAGNYANTTSGSYTSNPAIQSGQAFFVKANSSGVGSFTLTESKKTTTVSNLFGKTNQTTMVVNTNIALFRVGLYKQENTLWTGADGAMAVFYDAANNAVDDADGAKMENSTENIAFVRDAVQLSSEHHAFAQHQDEFFVKVWNTNVANYKLAIATENFQSTAMQATLHDLFLGTQTDLLLNGSVVEYPFEVTTNTASTGNRFKITFQNSALATTTWATQTIKIYPNPAKQGIVKLQLPQQDTSQLSYKLVNVLGQIMQSGDLQPSYNGVYEIPTQSLPNQNYILQVVQNQQVVATTQLVVQN
ncbi:hypothetical protein [Flavobacterium croceum]|uniref:hypothetical protein n=1 Tax=Flavobacterium croceum TaxID=370975 RepID=UPI0024A9611C|nr:hypothetical protein [Flavobacterium croceum]